MRLHSFFSRLGHEHIVSRLGQKRLAALGDSAIGPVENGIRLVIPVEMASSMRLEIALDLFENSCVQCAIYREWIMNMSRRFPSLFSPKPVDLAAFAAHLERLSLEPKSDMGQLFAAHEGRLIGKWAHYLEIYDALFARFRSKPDLGLLELGVSQGGSLELWKKYFHPKAKVAGIDLDPRCRFKLENLRVFVGSQDDRKVLKKAVKWLGQLDIVIDDGSHRSEHQNASLDYLFPLLGEGGLYVCEDLHSNYWPLYQGGYRKRGTFIERMKSLIDDLHTWAHRRKPADCILAGQVFAIHIYDSMIAIEKRTLPPPAHIEVGARLFI